MLRRDVLRCGGLLVASSLSRADEPSPRVTLEKEFPASALKAVSPDGSKIVLEDWDQRGYPLRVLEFGTWRTLFTGAFESRTIVVGFFGDSSRLFCSGPVPWRALVDLGSGERIVRHDEFALHAHTGKSYTPSGTNTMLVANWQSPPWETKSLTLISVPDEHPIAEVPFATEPLKRHPKSGTLTLTAEGPRALSADRKLLVYSFDNVLVCRSLENLSLLWTKHVEEGQEVYGVAISADRTQVAVALGDRPPARVPTQPVPGTYIGIHDCAKGSELTRLRLDGKPGIGLSRDGTMLALVSTDPGKKGAVVPSVTLYEVASGRKLAKVEHGTVPRGRHQWLESHRGLALTPDGNPMLTSGRATRVWRLNR